METLEKGVKLRVFHFEIVDDINKRIYEEHSFTTNDKVDLLSPEKFWGMNLIPIYAGGKLPCRWITYKDIKTIRYDEYPVYTEEYCQLNKGKSQWEWICDKVKHG